MANIHHPNQPDGFHAAAPDRPVHVVLEQRGQLGRWGTRLPWILFFLALAFAVSTYAAYRSYLQNDPRINERFFSHQVRATDKVAIITVEGAITHSDGFAKWQIDRVADDPDVKAVVVRVESPGGTVTGSDYLYHHLKKLREEKNIPLQVSMGGIAASGGYYISMAAGDKPDTIFAERTTWTGSIGVIIPHYNIADLLEQWKIQDDSIASGPLKGMGSPTRKLTPELAEREQKILQTLVDQTFAQFKEIVAEARPQLAKDAGAFEEATTGQIFTAKQALQLGLVDKLGFIEDAIERAIELGQLDKNNVRVVNYSRPQGLLEGALFGPTAQGGQINLAALLELSTPRAYYLCTWLPGVVMNSR